MYLLRWVKMLQKQTRSGLRWADSDDFLSRLTSHLISFPVEQLPTLDPMKWYGAVDRNWTIALSCALSALDSHKPLLSVIHQHNYGGVYYHMWTLQVNWLIRHTFGCGVISKSDLALVVMGCPNSASCWHSPKTDNRLLISNGWLSTFSIGKFLRIRQPESGVRYGDIRGWSRALIIHHSTSSRARPVNIKLSVVISIELWTSHAAQTPVYTILPSIPSILFIQHPNSIRKTLRYSTHLSPYFTPGSPFQNEIPRPLFVIIAFASTTLATALPSPKIPGSDDGDTGDDCTKSYYCNKDCICEQWTCHKHCITSWTLTQQVLS